MSEVYASTRRYPLADATLTIPPDRLERLKDMLESHGATVEPYDRDIYTVRFPAGTVRMELAFTDPQQHRIFFPDAFSFLIIDPPSEEKNPQACQ